MRCASFQTALWVPFIPFKVIKQEKRFEKLNVNKIFDFDGDRNIGYAANAARAIIEDFNGDGIDDIYPTNAQVQNIKGNLATKDLIIFSFRMARENGNKVIILAISPTKTKNIYGVFSWSRCWRY